VDDGSADRYGVPSMPQKPPPNKRPRRKRTTVAPSVKPPRGTKGGRPCLMTAATVARFLAYLRDGVWRDDAEALCGLGKGTVDSWLARGRREIEKRDVALQLDGDMPKLSKWGNFVTAVANAEASMIHECWGTLTEIRRMRGPSTVDPEGNTIPGPILHPEVASKNAIWQLTRKDNLRFGQGSQRTDITRPGGAGGDGADEDDAAAVMELLDRRIEKKIAEHGARDGE
jgi:hypothetical protein